jgi:hypothetical protein
MRAGLAVALVTLTCTASVAEARPVSPRSGGFEVGASGFVTEQGTEVVAGPQLHLAVRLPAGQTGSVSLIALDARLMLGDLDLAPYASLGLGVLFRAVRDEVDLTDLAQRPDAALPVGLGIETRLTDTLMLGFAARYTAILSDLDRTTGPIDVAAYLVFL